MPCGADAVGRNPEKHSRTRQAGPAAEALPVQIGAAGALKGKDLPERTAAETIDITNIHSQDDTIFQERPYRVRRAGRRGTFCRADGQPAVAFGRRGFARATDARRSFRRSPARDDHALEHECRRDHAEHGIAGHPPHRAVRRGGKRRRPVRRDAAAQVPHDRPTGLHDQQEARSDRLHRRHGGVQPAGGTGPERRGNRLSGKRQPPHRAQADRQRGVRLLAGQLGALPPQDIQRSVRHRRRGDALDAVRSDQAYDQGASGPRRVGL